MKPDQMSDGIRVSLAQQGSQKGPLRRLEGTEISALSLKPFATITVFQIANICSATVAPSAISTRISQPFR